MQRISSLALAMFPANFSFISGDSLDAWRYCKSDCRSLCVVDDSLCVGNSHPVKNACHYHNSYLIKKKCMSLPQFMSDGKKFHRHKKNMKTHAVPAQTHTRVVPLAHTSPSACVRAGHSEFTSEFARNFVKLCVYQITEIHNTVHLTSVPNGILLKSS
jgi:hypothetical protein